LQNLFRYFTEVRWFLPGLVVSFGAATTFAPWVGRRMAVPNLSAWLLLITLGIVISATLTPLPVSAAGGTCDFSRLTLAPLSALGQFNETSLNVLLFVPLGAAIGLLPAGTRIRLAVVAAALPVAIEFTQWLMPPIGRGCQSADVIDNVTGLVIGLLVGMTIRAGWGIAASRHRAR
jgi:glycopeptide antibiotics resistance protein